MTSRVWSTLLVLSMASAVLATYILCRWRDDGASGARGTPASSGGRPQEIIGLPIRSVGLPMDEELQSIEYTVVAGGGRDAPEEFCIALERSGGVVPREGPTFVAVSANRMACLAQVIRQERVYDWNPAMGPIDADALQLLLRTKCHVWGVRVYGTYTGSGEWLDRMRRLADTLRREAVRGSSEDGNEGMNQKRGTGK